MEPLLALRLINLGDLEEIRSFLESTKNANQMCRLGWVLLQEGMPTNIVSELILKPMLEYVEKGKVINQRTLTVVLYRIFRQKIRKNPIFSKALSEAQKEPVIKVLHHLDRLCQLDERLISEKRLTKLMYPRSFGKRKGRRTLAERLLRGY
jgi:hypothetical protein